jgi:N6-adenosine-specific RNA methylase IME4
LEGTMTRRSEAKPRYRAEFTKIELFSRKTRDGWESWGKHQSPFVA